MRILDLIRPSLIHVNRRPNYLNYPKKSHMVKCDQKIGEMILRKFIFWPLKIMFLSSRTAFRCNNTAVGEIPYPRQGEPRLPFHVRQGDFPLLREGSPLCLLAHQMGESPLPHGRWSGVFFFSTNKYFLNKINWAGVDLYIDFINPDITRS